MRQAVSQAMKHQSLLALVLHRFIVATPYLPAVVLNVLYRKIFKICCAILQHLTTCNFQVYNGVSQVLRIISFEFLDSIAREIIRIVGKGPSSRPNYYLY